MRLWENKLWTEFDPGPVRASRRLSANPSMQGERGLLPRTLTLMFMCSSWSLGGVWWEGGSLNIWTVQVSVVDVFHCCRLYFEAKLFDAAHWPCSRKQKTGTSLESDARSICSMYIRMISGVSGNPGYDVYISYVLTILLHLIDAFLFLVYHSAFVYTSVYVRFLMQVLGVFLFFRSVFFTSILLIESFVPYLF